jgi:hypothetical protein
MSKITKRSSRKGIAKKQGGKKSVRVRGERVPSFAEDFVIVRTDRFGRVVGQVKSVNSNTLLRKASKVLVRSGIKERTVFRDAKTGVFAYSVDPRNPERIIRRSADGKRMTGRFSDFD